MSVFDVVIVTAALCGLIMVAGGILLLYKGAITLTQTSDSEAVSLEFRRMLKITTHYPALGLFVIGLSFTVAGLCFSRPPAVHPFQLRGRVTGADPTVATLRISVGDFPVEMRPYSDGSVSREIYPPKMDKFVVEVIAPGRPPQWIPKKVDPEEMKTRTATFPDIALDEPQVRKPSGDPSTVHELRPASLDGQPPAETVTSPPGRQERS
jgi:hypothetical protein